MFVWQLRPILSVDGGPKGMALKAVKAKCAGVWIKIAVGQQRYAANAPFLLDVIKALENEKIRVWGWHEPRCATVQAAEIEANVVAALAEKLGISGILMDAEAPSGGTFFQGGSDEATAYSERLQRLLHQQGKPLALCSHDIPSNFPSFPFDAFALNADVNVPQVYYGGSPSVANRLDRAIKANSHVPLPFVPVGAGWVGNGGGCASDSACAERALAFIQLTKEHGFSGYSFWHWAGGPLKFWNALIANRLT